MKILVVGGGGREHALVWKIAQSPRAGRIYCAPGNAGIAGLAECPDIKASDLPGLLAFARREKIGLTVVGPEQPLTEGLADLFASAGLRVFGPSRAAARLEGSKAFAKALMDRCGIPTGFHRVFTDVDKARAYVEEKGAPLVVKADGLAAGKGVYVCRTVDEAREALSLMMVGKAFGAAGEKVVVEEYLEGEEASFLAFTDGRTVLPMASSQDHKTVFDGDRGPNTGGMGAYSPAPVVTPEVHRRIMDEIMTPAVRGLALDGSPYRGVLYAGVMVTAAGPKVLEFNVRFGDPETQPIMARMDGDLLAVMEACADGRLEGLGIRWKEEAAVCVVMASGGYPGDYAKGKVITGLAEAAGMKDLIVFHAGTARRGGNVVTDGGRVLGVTALGKTVGEAIAHAYRGVEAIRFDGAHYRRDIGRKALNRNPG